MLNIFKYIKHLFRRPKMSDNQDKKNDMPIARRGGVKVITCDNEEEATARWDKILKVLRKKKKVQDEEKEDKSKG